MVKSLEEEKLIKENNRLKIDLAAARLSAKQARREAESQKHINREQQKFTLRAVGMERRNELMRQELLKHDPMYTFTNRTEP